ncbi:MAG: hypothetical protein M0023_04640 [Desulfobacteraceae bacterium]|nr:hypothetical protein [Desulfobacteraceae bacterium]
MKCPKCGYNSFEIYDTCKKCANDLTGFKDIHGLKSIVLPLETRTAMAEKMIAERMQSAPAAVAAVPTDMFSFDVPEVEPTAKTASFPIDDPFNFDDEPAAPSPGGGKFAFGDDLSPAQAKGEEDVFSNLLETTPQRDLEKPSAAQSGADTISGVSELDDFSWDDTPDASPGEETSKPAEDDFNSLFGDTGDKAQK